MAYQNHQRSRETWALARKQHGVVTRGQLLGLGFTPQAILHRIRIGRLHPVWRGVYAAGRPSLTQHGRWMAAVLACGPDALLSHLSAAALWEIHEGCGGLIHVSVPRDTSRRRPGIAIHRRSMAANEFNHCQWIPVTGPVTTLVDLAATLDVGPVESAIREADRRNLVDPETLRTENDGLSRRPGVARLRRILDRRTFRLTGSALERMFLALARRAALPTPCTGRFVDGFKVDFHWPELNLVVETDGLRYHRTPDQQATDRLRDQAHAAAGTAVLRFTHSQVAFDPGHVERTLRAVVRRLQAAHRRIR